MNKPLNLTEIATLSDSMTASMADWKRKTEGVVASSKYFAVLSDATATLRQEVEAIGGHFGKPGDGISLTLGGMKASSTQGIQGACRNWLTAARKKLEAIDP